MGWPEILVVINLTVAAAMWIGKNDWSHKYIKALGNFFYLLNPWRRTNAILDDILSQMIDASGEPLRIALERLTYGLESVHATLAIIHVRQRLFDKMLATATITTDASGHVVWASEGLLALAGCTLEDMKGDGWINCIHQDDREMVANEWERAVNNGIDFFLCYRYISANGDRRETWVEAHAYAAKATASKPPVGWVAVVTRLDKPWPPSGERRG